MNRITRLVSSPTLAITLLLIFALSMATATFIENDFGTSTAWVLVYDSWWFEWVMILLGVCFLGNIYKYRLWRREKASILLFHIAFIVILFGAGVTRYTAFGGVMRIREGAKSNTIISDRNYVQVGISDGSKSKRIERELYFSPLKQNDFSIETEFSDLHISVSYRDFVADAAPEIVADEKGAAIVEMVVSAGQGRETIFLKEGEVRTFGAHQHKVGLNIDFPDAIRLMEDDGQLKLISNRPLDYFVMSSQSAGSIAPDSLQELKLRTLYRMGDFSFVPLSYHKSARVGLTSTAEKPKDNDEVKDDVLVINLQVGEENQEINLLYREGFLPIHNPVKVGGLDFHLAYGAVPIELPFMIGLEDFQLERYPGSESPSSYASEVKVYDEGEEKPYRIFMNNVLDYGGFRFFQASYDTDELGTVLAVNHDQLGTRISYLGYVLMGLGMFWTLFGKGSRFHQINRELKSLNLQKSTLLVFLGIFFLTPQAFSKAYTYEELAPLVEIQQIDKHHASLFGRLMVQDLDGRIKPVNTLASEFLRKISRRPDYRFESDNGTIILDANQTFLALHVDPQSWQNIPLIKIDKKKGGELFSSLRTTEEGLIPFNGLLDEKGDYVLTQVVEAANAKKPAERNEFDKEMLLVDERFNILFNVFSANYLKIFPKRGDSTNTWYSHSHHFADFPEEDAQFVHNIMPVYFRDIEDARENNDWVAAENNLAYIKLYQEVLAEAIMPEDRKVEAELWYNRINLNFWLFQVQWTLGFLLLITAIAHIFSDKRWIGVIGYGLVVLTLISFIAFTGNLALRWYIAGHAPWSNGYEMIVFVSWVLLLCGLLTHRKSDFALPLATLFSGTLLFVSYLDWLNPEITNLMPVLKSYWLKIHVATIVSSYAPLALSAILGVMALLLMIFKTSARADEFNYRIKELTLINEISMTIGLFLLAVGTFLGGVWANESWGRYWAWDPKETWALISAIVYAVVLHLRFVPSLRNAYVLNTASILAFSSIVMTSFGVNYYLSGLHSYAAGDPLPIPKFIYVVTLMVVMVAVIAYIRNKHWTAQKSVANADPTK